MNTCPIPIFIDIGISPIDGHLEFVDNPCIHPEGWMPVFDEDKTRPWSDKLFLRDLSHSGKTIHIVGL